MSRYDVETPKEALTVVTEPTVFISPERESFDGYRAICLQTGVQSVQNTEREAYNTVLGLPANVLAE